MLPIEHLKVVCPGKKEILRLLEADAMLAVVLKVAGASLTADEALLLELLIECADAALAERLAAHERTAKLCRRIGERGLVVDIEAEAKFRKAIRELGYGMPRG